MLLLPLLGKASDPTQNKHRQILQNRDEKYHPPIRYNRATTTPETVQTATSAELRSRECVNI